MSFWAVGISAAVSLGTAAYGASEQRKANNKAMDQNATLQGQQDSSAWSSYLMSRGMAPTGKVTPGVIPAAGQFKIVNTRLPLYATAPLGLGPTSSRKIIGYRRKA